MTAQVERVKVLADLIGQGLEEQAGVLQPGDALLDHRVDHASPARERRSLRGGAVINISSASARLGSPNEYVDYAASKGALETFTMGFAKEVAREGIRVNGVAAA